MHIRRIASPLTYYDENFSDLNYKETRRQKRKEFQLQLEKPASILIGSIKEINKRVCEFQNELQSYDCRLTFEKRIEDQRHKQTKTPDGIRFGGVYKKNLESIPLSSKKPKKKSIKGDTPQLVELQQYPGFDFEFPTPLPHSVAVETVNKKVVEAQTHLYNKIKYKELFEQALSTHYHHNLLKDFFWLVFLQKFSPNVEVQAELFKRIAVNYGWFFIKSPSQRFRDVFFKDYAEVLAQSLYSAFCLAFPQSWKQFDDENFKNLLSRSTNLWISGIRPHPRSYLKWNQTLLEPENMREGQQFKKPKPQGNKRKNKLKFTSVKDKLPLSQTALKSRSPVNNRSEQATSKTPTNRKTLSPISKRKQFQATQKTQSSAIDPQEVKFDHSKFNLNGNSPLLNQFFHQFGVPKSLKSENLVARTQVLSLPKPTCRTLHDMIDESEKLTGRLRRSFENIQKDGNFAFKEFQAKQLEDSKVLDIKTKKLLENKEQVSLLSNLVLSEVKKDPNVVASEAQRAIWLAVVAEKES